MDSIHSKHFERLAKLCKHTLHTSACMRTLWCARCIITAAQTDLERARRSLEAEGGPDASACMRDRAWNLARLQYATTRRRVNDTMRRDWQRQERERLWDEGHRWYVAQHGRIPFDPETCSPCIVCAKMTKQSQQYAQSTVCLTTAWWEREGALVEEEMVVPETPPRPLASGGRPPQSETKQTSYLAEFIQSWRSMRTVSDEERRSREDRYKLDRAIRRKYDLPDDYELEEEMLAIPLPAPHAKHLHRQMQNSEHAAERRANRHKRRAEDYRSCRSSLALSELAREVEVDEAELERLRLEAEAAELRRLVSVVASEVGYLYFVGEMGLLERWKEEFRVSDLDLIQRQMENGVYVGHEDEVEGEVEEEL